MGRAPCCDKNGLKKGPWTPEEDQKLLDYIQKHGHGKWRTLPKNAGLSRCGKSCRLRWSNYLRPDIKRGRFSFEEEETIIQLHSILGNKWSAIAARLPGRTDNEVKNFWNTHIRKRLLRMGIDPVTHSPRLDLLDLSSLLTPSLYGNPSQIDVSRLLGVQPALNAELLMVASSLLLAQRQNADLVHLQHALEDKEYQQEQQHQEPYQQQFANPTIEEQFQPSFPTQQSPNLAQETPAFIPSIATLAQQDASQLQPSEQEALWQVNSVFPCSNPDGFSMLQKSDSCGGTHFSMDACSLLSIEAPGFDPSGRRDFSFPSVLSTPVASSPTPLNSASTYVANSAGATSSEDERDSYCSSLLDFQIPDLLDISEFI